jgi:hypothetical protein
MDPRNRAETEMDRRPEPLVPEDEQGRIWRRRTSGSTVTMMMIPSAARSNWSTERFPKTTRPARGPGQVVCGDSAAG